MNQDQFFKKIQSFEKPVVVDFWAPWCGPCRAMEPAMKTISQQYAGKVEVWKINADEEPEVLRALGVMGIPTMIGYHHGQQVFRKTGAQNAQNLAILFEAVLNNQPIVRTLTAADRWLRIISAIALLVLAWTTQSYLLAAVSLVLAFSAVYDRCPVYKAVSARVSAWWKKKNSSGSTTG
ncbi:MAG TPA: thioredoxin [Anaerolineaceae bacterium]